MEAILQIETDLEKSHRFNQSKILGRLDELLVPENVSKLIKTMDFYNNYYKYDGLAKDFDDALWENKVKNKVDNQCTQKFKSLAEKHYFALSEIVDLTEENREEVFKVIYDFQRGSSVEHFLKYPRKKAG